MLDINILNWATREENRSPINSILTEAECVNRLATEAHRYNRKQQKQRKDKNNTDREINGVTCDKKIMYEL